jgi:hypothetical protein
MKYKKKKRKEKWRWEVWKMVVDKQYPFIYIISDWHFPINQTIYLCMVSRINSNAWVPFRVSHVSPIPKLVLRLQLPYTEVFS